MEKHSYIPSNLYGLLVCFKDCFSKPVFEYFVAYIWCMLITEGRKTITRIIKNCFFLKKHIASWERFIGEYKWNYLDVAKRVTRLLLDKFGKNFIVHGKYLIALDTTLIAKNSNKMFGTQKWADHSGNADKGEYLYGHHWSVLGLVGKFLVSRFICFLVLLRLITGTKANWQWMVDSEGNVRHMTIWDVSYALILQVVEWVNMPIRVVADAYFSNKSFVQYLMDKDIDVISRLKSNAIAYEDFEQPKEKRRGRPRKRGKKIHVSDIVKTESRQVVSVLLYGKETTLGIWVKDLWLLELSKKARVVVVNGGKKFTALMSTDLNLPAEAIIEIYGSRFSIEIAIRDMKQHLGLCDYQCGTLTGMLRFVHLAAAALCIGRILLLENGSNKLTVSDDKEKGIWTSILSLNRLRYDIRRYALAKLVFAYSAISGDSAKMMT